MINFRIRVQVVAEETGMALPGLFVKAYDKDLLFDDLLGSAFTNKEGRVDILCEQGDFKEFFDVRPDVYFKVYAPDRSRLLFDSSEAVRWDVGRESSFVIRIPLKKLHDAYAKPSVLLFSDSDQVTGGRLPAVGDSLMISAQGLAPAATHDIEVYDGEKMLFVSRLMTNQYGMLPDSVLWPQFGLDDPHSETIYTVDEADERWRGKKLGVRIVRGKSVLVSGSVTIKGFDRPFIMNTDRDGRMLNGFEDGKGEVAVSGYNFPKTSKVRVHLVERQADWKPGDSFTPVILRNGNPAFADAQPDKRGRFRVILAEPGNIDPGAYDFIVRPIRYGYEDDEDFVLHDYDVVTRRVTGVVIRHDFWQSKVVHLGCVNMMPLSGRTLNEPPYFRYSDAFSEGEDVYAAVDPAALPPVKMGKMVAIYIVQSKTSAQWDADKSLNHLSVLGGNGAVIKFKTQADCINHNKILVWPAASIPGNYDIVLDFGNNSSDPLAFVPDNQYTIEMPPAVGDIIDGYIAPGFRVVKDPGIYTDPSFAYVGGFDYINEGSLPFIGDDGISRIVPLTARVKFPADVPGATLPSQISAVKASYPMTIIVHGNGHDYRSYDYLLDHWARNGFIAASINLSNDKGGQTATDRAKVLFQHIGKLKTKFGTKAENNIGIMGHSRGGEGVATAPRLNYQGSLGHNINAVISLAPTNQHVDEHIIPPWATPYYVIYGSLDGDVTGESLALVPLRNCGFALYDKAEGSKKAMLFVYGATHDRFLTPPSDPDLDYNKLSPTDKLNALSANAHQVIAKAYMTACFRQQLLNDTQFDGMFKGEWVPPSVALADAGKAKLFCQYRDVPANRKTIDDFEEVHTGISWKDSTIKGGKVSQTGLPADPTENFLYVADNVYSPHNTSGLVARWDNSGDRLEFTVPADHKNLSGFQALSFRVTQKYDPTGLINPLNADQDFYILLRDLTSKERMVKVSKFGRIPYPHVRGTGWFGNVIKSALCTIRIPLHAFTIECAGAQRVDLAQVEKLAFVYQYISTGEIEVDDIEFTI